MPVKQKYIKEDILNAAFNLVKKTGINSITARKIASELGASTAPIYTYYKNMEEIKEDVLKKLRTTLLDSIKRKFTDNVFLNIGVGSLVFVREYQKVCQEIFLLDNNMFKSLFEDKDYYHQIKKDENLSMLDEANLSVMLEKMSIYTLGLASLICSNALEDTSTEYFINNLKGMGEDVIGYTLYKKGKLDEYLNKVQCQEECRERSENNEINFFKWHK